ncbi:Putative_PNPOx domain-containing protein [Ruminococcaceae bacterium BL-6]|nr:Putative_PNPOx domain-containing protein [Ruminococcaceae bacterium BL-6]
MNEAVRFLRDCGTFYLATEDGDQPRVRPFGAVMEYEGKIYLSTNNTKNVFHQMKKNPKVEIAAAKDGGEWIRLTGEAVVDDREAARARMLEEVPMLKKMYRAGDGVFEVLFLKNVMASIYSLDGKVRPVSV